MLFKILYVILIFIVCLVVYRKVKKKEHSLPYIIITGLIAGIIGNLLIPSDISIFSVARFFKEYSKEHKQTTLEIFEQDSNYKSITVGSYKVSEGESEILFIPPYDGQYVLHITGLTEDNIAGMTVTDKYGNIQGFTSRKIEDEYEITVDGLVSNEEYTINISLNP